MSRGWKIALVVSLVLNLFLLGAGIGVAIVGHNVLHEREMARRGGGGGDRVFAAFQALPEARRAALRDIMRAQAVAAAPDLRAAGEARRMASQLIAAPDYDAKAVGAALAEARNAEAHARARIDATLAARLAELSPQERATFARVLLRGPGRGGRGRGDGDGPHRGPPDHRGPHGPPDGPPPPAGPPGPPPPR